MVFASSQEVSVPGEEGELSISHSFQIYQVFFFFFSRHNKDFFMPSLFSLEEGSARSWVPGEESCPSKAPKYMTLDSNSSLAVCKLCHLGHVT